MERCGADAVVAEGSEAGGHIGENTTMVLVPQIADAVSIPVLSLIHIYLRPFVTEKNDPTPQIEKLHELFDEIHYYELPKTTDDFESRAKLYHILMDLEEFLIFNRRFVEGLDERQRRIYWEE